MKRIVFVTFIVLAVLGVSFVVLMLQLGREEESSALLQKVLLRVGTKDLIVEVAGDPASQKRGLSFRPFLEVDHGMLFLFDEPKKQRFWMYEMRFPIDIVFIRDRTITEIVPHVPEPHGGIPAVVTSQANADWVLEVNAGKADEWGLNIGDTVTIIGK